MQIAMMLLWLKSFAAEGLLARVAAGVSCQFNMRPDWQMLILTCVCRCSSRFSHTPQKQFLSSGCISTWFIRSHLQQDRGGLLGEDRGGLPGRTGEACRGFEPWSSSQLRGSARQDVLIFQMHLQSLLRVHLRLLAPTLQAEDSLWSFDLTFRTTAHLLPLLLLLLFDASWRWKLSSCREDTLVQ